MKREDVRDASIIAVATALFIAACLLVGCANPIAAAKTTISGTAIVLKGAEAAWAAADIAKQQQIMEDAKNLADAIDGVKRYRAEVQPKVNQALATTGGALLTAARALFLYESGMQKKADLLSVLKSLWDQVTELRKVLEMYDVRFDLGGALMNWALIAQKAIEIGVPLVGQLVSLAIAHARGDTPEQLAEIDAQFSAAVEQTRTDVIAMGQEQAARNAAIDKQIADKFGMVDEPKP